MFFQPIESYKLIVILMANTIKNKLNKEHLLKSKILSKTIPLYLKATYSYAIIANQPIKKHSKVLQYICYQITTTFQKKYFLDCSLKQKNYKYITTKINQSTLDHTLKTVLPWMIYWTKKKSDNIVTYVLTIKGLHNVSMNTTILQKSNVIIKNNLITDMFIKIDYVTSKQYQTESFIRFFSQINL